MDSQHDKLFIENKFITVYFQTSCLSGGIITNAAYTVITSIIMVYRRRVSMAMSYSSFSYSVSTAMLNLPSCSYSLLPSTGRRSRLYVSPALSSYKVSRCLYESLQYIYLYFNIYV